MKNINLYEIWKTLEYIEELDEDYYPDYYSNTYEEFLSYYSFKITGQHILIFNDDDIGDGFSIEEFIYLPIKYLTCSEEKLKELINLQKIKDLEFESLSLKNERNRLKERLEIIEERLKGEH